jgi:hypothetical protein
MKVTRHRSLKIFLDHYSNIDVLNARRVGENLTKFQAENSDKSKGTSNDAKAALEEAA